MGRTGFLLLLQIKTAIYRKQSYARVFDSCYEEVIDCVLDGESF
jgi:hypothetical protein